MENKSIWTFIDQLGEYNTAFKYFQQQKRIAFVIALGIDQNP